MAATLEAQRRVVCPGCGNVRWLTARNARGGERGETTGLCSTCRHPPRLSTQAERDAAIRWWLDQYSDEEIAGFALALGVKSASAEYVAARRKKGAGLRRTGQTASGPSPPYPD